MGNSAAKALLGLLARNKDAAGRVILLTGPWGCGKTHAWKNEVAPNLGRPYVYVSAYGCATTTELTSKLMTQFALTKARSAIRLAKGGVGRFLGIKGEEDEDKKVSTIAAIANATLGNVLQRFHLDPLEFAHRVPTETVVCIDDIERASASFKIEELLGVANILSEHNALDVVLICNEDQLGSTADQRQRYLDYKEKTVSAAVHLRADVGTLFDHIASGATRSEAAKARVLAAKPIILSVFERSASRNLRSMSRIMMLMDQLHEEGAPELPPPQVRFLCALVLDLASGAKADSASYDFNPAGIRIAASMRAKGAPMDPLLTARQAFLARYFTEADDYEYRAEIFEFVRDGNFDPVRFAPAVSAPLTGAKAVLAKMSAATWRFSDDTVVGGLTDELETAILSNGATSASQVLECLSWWRFLSNILSRQQSSAVTNAASAQLQVFAQAASIFEHNLDGWAQSMGDTLVALVKTEMDSYVAQHATVRATRMRAHALGVLQRGDVAEVVKLVSDPDSSWIGVWADASVQSALLQLDGECFIVAFQGLFERATFSSYAPVIQQLEQQLESLSKNTSTTAMQRWRAQALLKRR